MRNNDGWIQSKKQKYKPIDFIKSNDPIPQKEFKGENETRKNKNFGGKIIDQNKKANGERDFKRVKVDLNKQEKERDKSERSKNIDEKVEMIEIDAKDEWNDDYVKMPYSAFNKNEDGRSKWEQIKTILSNPINNLTELKNTIWRLNEKQRNKWDLKCLTEYIESISSNKRRKHFEMIIPRICKLALKLPNLMNYKPIPILKKGQNKTIMLSQFQIASLMANAFFCTFPTNRSKNLPSINFDTLHNSHQTHRKFYNQEELQKNVAKKEKYKCLFNYFNTIFKKGGEYGSSEILNGCLSFQRQFLKNFPIWHSSHRPLSNLQIFSEGTIEDSPPFSLQVDFANKVIGGFFYLIFFFF